jgi:predicted  nucleic acid-binding Zn-ribbon protein
MDVLILMDVNATHAQTEMGSDSEMLIHEISNIHKQKNQLREKLDDATRERNHLTELISLLATQHPHLFQEESDLHQSMDSAAWQHIKDVRNSMRLPR